MGRCAPPIEQARLAQNKGTGANRDNASNLAMTPAEPSHGSSLGCREALCQASTRDDQHVRGGKVAGFLERERAAEQEAMSCAHRAARRREEAAAIDRPPHDLVGVAKHRPWSADIQKLPIGENEKPHLPRVPLHRVSIEELGAKCNTIVISATGCRRSLRDFQQESQRTGTHEAQHSRRRSACGCPFFHGTSTGHPRGRTGCTADFGRHHGPRRARSLSKRRRGRTLYRHGSRADISSALLRAAEGKDPLYL